MDIREKRANAYEEPTTEELPPLAEELRHRSFREFMERSNRQFEEDRAAYLAEQADAHEERRR
jgi:hypothetical protein